VIGAARALGGWVSRAAARVMPDPLVLAVLLTFVTLGAALTVGRAVEGLPLGARLDLVVVKGWGEGLFGAEGLAFAFQMVLVLVTGGALARSPAVVRLIGLLARAPQTAAQASALVAAVSCAAGLLHWGLGAVAGAMLARALGRAWARTGRALHYPLLGAAAYSGLLVWHGGLSGSAPLKVAEVGHFLESVTGVIPIQQTLLSPLNLVIEGALVLLTASFYALLTPSDPAAMIPCALAGEEEAPPPLSSATSAWLRVVERSPLLPWALAALVAVVLGAAAWGRGAAALTLNTLNLAFFGAGLALHGSPARYLEAAAQGARESVGIVLQFPLYFGMLGVLKSSGLIAQLSEVFVAVSTRETLPLFGYLSAGLVNLFVPSGGGQWAVQGPVLMEAARSLGADQPRVVLALAHGDAWTNLLQPFWALPLLGIMGLKARDIAGYTALLCAVVGPVTALLLWLW
jgi:short-chain fatty acids transporter